MSLTVKTSNGYRDIAVTPRFSFLIAAHSACPAEHSDDGAHFTSCSSLFLCLQSGHQLFLGGHSNAKPPQRPSLQKQIPSNCYFQKLLQRFLRTVILASLLLLLPMDQAAADPIQQAELQTPDFRIYNGHLEFTLATTVVGHSYQLQYSKTLTSWQDLGGEILGTGNSLKISVESGTVNASFFSRVKVLEPATDPDGFVLIPEGSFSIGDAMDGLSNAPVHMVNVSSFYCARNIVTQLQWDTMRTWALAQGYADFGAVPTGYDPEMPVSSVSWFDAILFCNARSQKEGLTPCYYNAVSGTLMKSGTNVPTVNWSANGYRLPTEAEWEKAARGGLLGKRFPWGDTITRREASYKPEITFAYDLNAASNFNMYNYGLTPVGSYAANGYGLNDMAGNLIQWCWDWSGAYDTSSTTDPRGPSSGFSRVGRGGSYVHTADFCRVAARDQDSPTGRYHTFGCRLVRNSLP